MFLIPFNVLIFLYLKCQSLFISVNEATFQVFSFIASSYMTVGLHFTEMATSSLYFQIQLDQD